MSSSSDTSDSDSYLPLKYPRNYITTEYLKNKYPISTQDRLQAGTSKELPHTRSTFETSTNEITQNIIINGANKDIRRLTPKRQQLYLSSTPLRRSARLLNQKIMKRQNYDIHSEQYLTNSQETKATANKNNQQYSTIIF